MFTDNEILTATKQHVWETVAAYDPVLKQFLARHLDQVDYWLDKASPSFPEANVFVLKLGMLLHDIGQVVGPKEFDHAVNSETHVRWYLSILCLDQSTIEQVAHVARAHRCKDVMPQTIEAQMLAACDSAAHFSDPQVYFKIALDKGKKEILEKLARDWRDVQRLPQLSDQLQPYYDAWVLILSKLPDESLV